MESISRRRAPRSGRPAGARGMPAIGVAVARPCAMWASSPAFHRTIRINRPQHRWRVARDGPRPALPCAASSSTRSAISSWTKRSAKRGASLAGVSKAEVRTSATTCSGKRRGIDDHRVLAPVSAISDVFPRSESLRWMISATSVDPVNTTPSTRPSPTRRSPGPLPVREAIAAPAPGTPASRRRRTASAAMRGVCSAGFATGQGVACRRKAPWVPARWSPQAGNSTG